MQLKLKCGFNCLIHSKISEVWLYRHLINKKIATFHAVLILLEYFIQYIKQFSTKKIGFVPSGLNGGSTRYKNQEENKTRLTKHYSLTRTWQMTREGVPWQTSLIKRYTGGCSRHGGKHQHPTNKHDTQNLHSKRPNENERETRQKQD